MTSIKYLLLHAVSQFYKYLVLVLLKKLVIFSFSYLAIISVRCYRPKLFKILWINLPTQIFDSVRLLSPTGEVIKYLCTQKYQE